MLNNAMSQNSHNIGLKIGIALCLLGMFLLAQSAVVYMFFSPPGIHELRPVSGHLRGKIDFYRSKAQFDLRTPEGISRIHIENTTALCLSGINRLLVKLEPNTPLVVMLEKNGLVAWEISTNDTSILSYFVTRQADSERTQHGLIMGFSLLMLGAVLIFWPRQKSRI